MTHSGIVQKYREGIGVFDLPEGAGENVTNLCYLYNSIRNRMSDTYIMALCYCFKFIGLLKPFLRCNEDPDCRNPCGF